MAFLEDLEALDFEALLAEFDHPALPISAEFQDSYFDEVACALRNRDPDRTTNALLKRLDGADPARAAAILLGLSLLQERDRSQTSTFRAALADQRPQVIAAAVDALRAVGDRTCSAVIAPLVGSSDGKVRAAALRFIAAERHPDAVRILRHALRDPDLYVRANAVDELVDLVGVEALPWVRPLARDPARLVRETVAGAVEIERNCAADEPSGRD